MVGLAVGEKAVDTVYGFATYVAAVRPVIAGDELCR